MLTPALADDELSSGGIVPWTARRARRMIDGSALVQTIADRVRHYREERDLTVEQVAARTGMSKSHVAAIEKGRLRAPTVLVVLALAKAFGVSMADLLGEAPRAAQLSTAALRVASMFDAELRAAEERFPFEQSDA